MSSKRKNRAPRRRPQTQNGQTVESLEKVRISNVRPIDVNHMRKCIKMATKDLYISNAISINSNLVLSGDVSVHIGQSNYPGVSPQHKSELDDNLLKALQWIYTCGFVPFGFKNDRYKKRKQRVDDDDGNYDDDYGDGEGKPPGLHKLNDHVFLASPQEAVDKEFARDLEKHPINTFVKPVIEDQYKLMREGRPLQEGFPRYRDGNGKSTGGNYSRDTRNPEQVQEITKQLFDFDNIPISVAKEMPGISSIDSKISEDFNDHLNTNQMANITGSGQINEEHGSKSMDNSAVDDIAPNPFATNRTQNTFLDPLSEGRSFLVDLLMKVRERKQSENDQGVIFREDKLNAEDGDLDFVVPDLSVDFGTFFSYRENGINTTKLFVRVTDEEEDEEYFDENDEDYFDEMDDNYYIQEEDREFVSKTSSGQVQFDNGAVGVKGHDGIQIGADYVEEIARRNGYKYNPFDGISDEYRNTMNQEIVEKTARAIRQSDGRYVSGALILQPGEYLPGENPREQFGVKTNIYPELYKDREMISLGGHGNPNETDVRGYPKRYVEQTNQEKGYPGYSAKAILANRGEMPVYRKDVQFRERNLSAKEKRALKVLTKSKFCYYVYVVKGPDEKGKLNSDVALLMDAYVTYKQATKTQKIYNQKSLFPTLVIQKTKETDKGMEKSKYRKADAVGFNASDKGKTFESVSKEAQSSISSQNLSNAQKLAQYKNQYKALTADELTQARIEQIQLQEKALRQQALLKDYNDAFDNNLLHTLPTNLVFKMNTHKIDDGHEFVSFYTPPAPPNLELQQDSYVRQVCTTFGIPKRIFDHDVQKWKSDIGSETDPHVDRLTPLRKVLKNMYSCMYYAKNGYSLTKHKSKKIDQFFKQETTIINAFVGKLIEKMRYLGLLANTRATQFFNAHKEKVDQTKKSIKDKDQLMELHRQLESEVSSAKLKEVKKYGLNPPQPKQPAAKPGAAGAGKAGKPPSSQSLDDFKKISDFNSYEDAMHKNASTGHLEALTMKQGALGGGSKSGGKSGSSNGDNYSINAASALMYPETFLQEHEKFQELCALQAYIAFVIDSIDKYEQTLKFLEKHKWNIVTLSFDTPIMTSLESIERIATMIPMSERKIKSLISNKFGADTW